MRLATTAMAATAKCMHFPPASDAVWKTKNAVAEKTDRNREIPKVYNNTSKICLLKYKLRMIGADLNAFAHFVHCH